MTEQERKAWLEDRRKGVGSSDAAAICGFGQWGSAFSVYLDKIGELPDKDSKPKEWGRKLEDVVAEAYREETGHLTVAPDVPTLFHAEYPWMLASVDRVATRPDGTKVVVELKTSGFDDEWGEPGTDQIPDDYNIQVQHQLAVVGLEEADVAVLIAGRDFRIYKVQRKQTLIDKLIQIEGDFWEHVKNRIPPRPDWEHPKTPELMKNLYGLQTGLSVQLGEEELRLVRAWQYLKQQQREATKEVARYRAQLDYLMGVAEFASLPDGSKLIRKPMTRKAHDVQESSWTQLILKEAK